MGREWLDSHSDSDNGSFQRKSNQTKNTVDHTLNCKLGGFVNMRHNNIRDLEATILKPICRDVRIEPALMPIGCTGTESTNIADKARADVSAVGVWSPMERTFLDVRVVHLNSPSYEGQTSQNHHPTEWMPLFQNHHPTEWMPLFQNHHPAEWMPLFFITIQQHRGRPSVGAVIQSERGSVRTTCLSRARRAVASRHVFSFRVGGGVSVEVMAEFMLLCGVKGVNWKNNLHLYICI